MSDTVLITIISGVLSTIVSPIVIAILTYFQNKKIKANGEKVDIIRDKLDENHKQQNGNLTKLLETTKELATANEKAKHPKK